MTDTAARFAIGQLVHHRLFGYRGVIYDVDAVFSGTDAWYDQVARSRPPRDRPWYHVLVHGSATTTYVAERNLQSDDLGEPVDHPEIGAHFNGFADGAYRTARTAN